MTGCHTKERPTRLFIEGHKKRYMEKTDDVMLKPIALGRGNCHDRSGCGNNGRCVESLCVCDDKFVGPHCLSDNKFEDDPFIDDVPQMLFFSPYLPTFSRVLLTVFIMGGLAGYFRAVRRRKAEKDLLRQPQEQFATLVNRNNGSYQSSESSFGCSTPETPVFSNANPTLRQQNNK